MENDTKHRILAIDDEPIIIRVSVRVLTGEGFDVEVAGNGQIAKDMCEKRDYDFYLSDIRTPSMNGMQFFEWLQKEKPGRAERVIFMTGDVMSPDVRNFLRKHNNLFLPKPFMPDELRAIMRKAVATSGAQVRS
jgi:CheY-like chemotaxis protein